VFCEMVERISEADGSAGWVASFGMGVTYLAALPRATFEQLYARSPDVILAGGLFPLQSARRIGRGFEVSGRWRFASGCMGATVFGVGITPIDEDSKSAPPRMAVLSKDVVTIVPNWDVMGLVGTGSHDLVVDKVIVPEEWTFLRGGRSNLDEPMFRYPSLSFASQVLAVVGLGVARGALDEARHIATSKRSIVGTRSISERPQCQVEIAVCEAKLRAARAFFYEAIDAAWDSLIRGNEVTREQTNMLRLSATYAARTSAEVARSLQLMVGTTAIYNASPLSMQVRDAMVVTQHAFLSDTSYENAGAMLFGLAPAPGYL